MYAFTVHLMNHDKLKYQTHSDTHTEWLSSYIYMNHYVGTNTICICICTLMILSKK